MIKARSMMCLKAMMAIFFLTSTGCQKSGETTMAPKELDRASKQESLVIAVVPERNVFAQRRQYNYLAEYFSEKLGMDVTVEILPDYAAICDGFIDGKVDAGFFGSFSFGLTHARVNVEPLARPVMLNGSSTYAGYIVARKDSGIKTIEDMKGKTLVLTDRATTAGYLFQVAYFKEHGVNDMYSYFSKVSFAGSHDAAAWAVFSREADVGGCKNTMFNELVNKFPDFKENMVVIAESNSVPSNALAVSSSLSKGLKGKLKEALLGMDKDPDGRAALKNFGALKFVETTDEDYAPLNKMAEEAGIDMRTYPYKP